MNTSAVKGLGPDQFVCNGVNCGPHLRGAQGFQRLEAQLVHPCHGLGGRVKVVRDLQGLAFIGDFIRCGLLLPATRMERFRQRTGQQAADVPLPVLARLPHVPVRVPGVYVVRVVLRFQHHAACINRVRPDGDALERYSKHSGHNGVTGFVEGNGFQLPLCVGPGHFFSLRE
jgi:hypothetical protein